jgi:hypothetical protein
MKSVDRNIYPQPSGTFQVRITRRPNPELVIGGIMTIEHARKVRDDYAASHPKSMRHLQPRVKHRRTFADRRREREALGLCPYCGQEPPKPGCVRCAGCQEYGKAYRQNRKELCKSEI